MEIFFYLMILFVVGVITLGGFLLSFIFFVDDGWVKFLKGFFWDIKRNPQEIVRYLVFLPGILVASVVYIPIGLLKSLERLIALSINKIYRKSKKRRC